jgi:hypothetical protein
MGISGRKSVRIVLSVAAIMALAALAAGRRGFVRAEETSPEDPVVAAVKKLTGPAREEVLAFARLMAIRPSMAIDFSRTSGEYCLDTGGHVMAHFSVKPDQTSEDIVFFVDAAPLVTKGLRLDQVPALDPGLGRMQPNTWYRYEGKGTEPHHGREMGGRTWLMLAVDVK